MTAVTERRRRGAEGRSERIERRTQSEPSEANESQRNTENVGTRRHTLASNFIVVFTGIVIATDRSKCTRRAVARARAVTMNRFIFFYTFRSLSPSASNTSLLAHCVSLVRSSSFILVLLFISYFSPDHSCCLPHDFVYSFRQLPLSPASGRRW